VTGGKRGTGRTARMLEEAVRQAEAGRAVYVLAADVSHARELAKRVPLDLGIKFETVRSLGSALDPQALRLQGTHPNCVLLVDHHAIERGWARVIREYHRFDAPEPER
jgi:hypothetical protein